MEIEHAAEALARIAIAVGAFEPGHHRDATGRECANQLVAEQQHVNVELADVDARDRAIDSSGQGGDRSVASGTATASHHQT
jgi:hypothetical protein